MHTVKLRFLILATLVIATTTALAALPNQTQEKLHSAGQKATDSKKGIGDNPAPVVDYEANYKISVLKNTKEHTLRQARGARYNGRAPEPLGELAVSEEGYAIVTEWEIGLPPLPADQSDAVILGNVVGAQAYLANDKTSVYSEFTLNTERVFKNSASLPLIDSLIVEREGGIVRLPSGRLLPFKIFHQGMPRVGRHYVFFLKRNEQGEDYHILTGYELRHGRVSPLDDLEKFATYKNWDMAKFLDSVQEAIAHAAQEK